MSPSSLAPEATRVSPEGRRAGRAAGRARWRVDLAGLWLAAAAAGWTYVAAARSGGDPGPVAGMFLASAAALVAARLLGSAGRGLVPAAVVAVAALLVLRAPDDLLRTAPLSGPFGYNNATAGFMVQAAVAALMLATLVRWAPVRLAAVAGAIAFGIIPFAIGSLAGAIPLVVLAVASLAWSRGGPRAAIVAAGAVFGAALAATVVLGALYGGGERTSRVDRAIDETLSERRVVLWHDALAIMGEQPLAGVGPGRFREVSPTALDDRDAVWAHQGFLQQGAEQGVVGFALLTLLFSWGFARLWTRRHPGALAVLGAVALAVLGIHASIDYVLHFPAIPIAAAGLLGTAIGPFHGRRRRGRRVVAP